MPAPTGAELHGTQSPPPTVLIKVELGQMAWQAGDTAGPRPPGPSSDLPSEQLWGSTLQLLSEGQIALLVAPAATADPWLSVGKNPCATLRQKKASVLPA